MPSGVAKKGHGTFERHACQDTHALSCTGALHAAHSRCSSAHLARHVQVHEDDIKRVWSASRLRQCQVEVVRGGGVGRDSG